tara:strand:+ start:947 stop:1681 length:735 start_codon:yes stop_codon:yes gene_type:complete
MAVSVDTVYQRVLALANKEQRGYITPQEFNLLANQAQMEIFESYFYVKNNRNRTEPDRSNEIDETDIDELLNRKLSPFSIFQTVTSGTTFPANGTISSVARPVFQYGMVLSGNEPCQKISVFEAQRLKNSTRHMATTAGRSPFYCDSRTTGEDIQVYDGGDAPVTSGVTVECFCTPRAAQWAYVVVNNKALYNANVAVDFELHRSEEDTLVNKILELAGIVMNDPTLAQLSAQNVATEDQLQKV